jgi:hypothetical protein
MRAKRRHARRPVEIPATVYAAGEPLACVVTSLSRGGARLVFDREAPAGRHLAIYLGAARPLMECAVAWRDGREVGIYFCG